MKQGKDLIGPVKVDLFLQSHDDCNHVTLYVRGTNGKLLRILSVLPDDRGVGSTECVFCETGGSTWAGRHHR